MNAQTFLFIILLGIAVVLEIIIFSTGASIINFIIALVVLLFAVLAFATKYYTYLMLPALRMKGRSIVINPDEPFIMAPGGNAIVMREGNFTYASAFIKIPVYRSSTEMSDEEKAAFSRLFGRMLTLTTTPIKISAQLYPVNKDEYINNIKSRLDVAEEQYAKLSVDKSIPKSESERLRGEVTMWRNLYDNISAAQAQTMVVYAMLTARGGSEEEAVNLAYQQADELTAGISSILGVNAYVIKDREILEFIEPNYMIPVETINERIRQRTIKQGV
jgi:hypothetical protein